MSEGAGEDSKQLEDFAELIGGKLRSAREAKSMAVVEVARRLNLEVQVVEALEQNNHELLPEPAYIRGYLLAYIRLMDLPVALLKSFDEANLVNQSLLKTSQPVQSACSQDGWVRCISTGLVIVLVIVLVLWVLEQSFHLLDIEMAMDEQNDTIESPIEQVVTPASVPPVESELNESAAVMDESTGSEMDQMENSQTEKPVLMAGEQNQSMQVEAEVAEEVVVVDVEQEKQVPVLTMKFSDDTWIRIDDSEGNRLEAGTFHKGQDISLAHDGELHLIIGRTKNVELGYAGEVVDLSGYNAGKVARLVLGRRAE